MMKLIVLLALFGVAVAQFGRPRPNLRSSDITIVRQAQENDGNGVYSFSYETSDGTQAQERGYLKPPQAGSDEPIQVAEGSYAFISPEGQNFRLNYLADENGFQPAADYLPTAPPIPEAIARALQIIYKNAGDQRASASSFQARPPTRPFNNRRF